MSVNTKQLLSAMQEASDTSASVNIEGVVLTKTPAGYEATLPSGSVVSGANARDLAKEIILRLKEDTNGAAVETVTATPVPEVTETSPEDNFEEEKAVRNMEPTKKGVTDGFAPSGNRLRVTKLEVAMLEAVSRVNRGHGTNISVTRSANKRHARALFNILSDGTMVKSDLTSEEVGYVMEFYNNILDLQSSQNMRRAA